MSAPVNGRISRGLGGARGAALEQIVEKAAGQMQQLAQQLDDFEGGTANSDVTAAAVDQMRAMARMASAQDFGGFNGQGLDGLGGSIQGLARQNGFDPTADNEVGGGAARQRFPTGADAELEAMAEAGGAGGYFEDKIFALMCKVVEDMQKQIEKRLQELQKKAKEAEGKEKGEDKGSESRNIEFEKIKFDMQKLSQMQQAMSNVLNTMDELAKSAIRHIKAG